MTAPETLLDGRVMLYPGDCLAVLNGLEPNSLDACVCDPPYHLASIVKRFGGKTAAAAKSNGKTGVYRRASAGFMGKEWDGGEIAFRPETWEKVLRVLKPGAHLIAFAAPKNVHWLAGAIETAGFEIRDRLIELISLDPLVARFLESLNEAQVDAFLRLLDESDFAGELHWIFGSGFPKNLDISKQIDKRRDWDALRKVQDAIKAAAAWQGWGTSLKPAYEPIVLARKPVEGSNAESVLKYGTGAINIEACKVGNEERVAVYNSLAPCKGNRLGHADTAAERRGKQGEPMTYFGRWPANVLHDGSEDATTGFPSEAKAGSPVSGDAPSSVHNTVYGDRRRVSSDTVRDDTGSASRFFYSAKADANDRLGSKHPTIKPLALMQYLVRLITPPGGAVLDCFAGTGTTGEAAWREGFNAVLIEREPEYQDDIRQRMELATAGPKSRIRAANKRRADQDTLDDLPIFAGGAGK